VHIYPPIARNETLARCARVALLSDMSLPFRSSRSRACVRIYAASKKFIKLLAYSSLERAYRLTWQFKSLRLLLWPKIGKQKRYLCG